jgi:hypothetical protein
MFFFHQLFLCAVQMLDAYCHLSFQSFHCIQHPINGITLGARETDNISGSQTGGRDPF